MSGCMGQENDGFNTHLERRPENQGKSGGRAKPGERSEEEGPGVLGGTRVADGRQSPQPTCGRQMGAVPGPGCQDL